MLKFQLAPNWLLGHLFTSISPNLGSIPGESIPLFDTALADNPNVLPSRFFLAGMKFIRTYEWSSLKSTLFSGCGQGTSSVTPTGSGPYSAVSKYTSGLPLNVPFCGHSPDHL